MLAEEDVATYPERLVSYQLLEEDATTYHKRLVSYWKKMLQRIKNILEGTGTRCFNVSGTSCKLLEEDGTTYHVYVVVHMNAIVPPPSSHHDTHRQRSMKSEFMRSCI